MKLLVIRHAIAMEKEEFRKLKDNSSSGTFNETGEISGERVTERDRLRPLTASGIKKMHKNAAGLRKVFSGIDILISSPLVRAIQTAEIVIDTYGVEAFLQTETLAPGADYDDFFAYLKSGAKMSVQMRAKMRAKILDCGVAIVGHEPHLSGLIAYALTGHKTILGELRKGGACAIEFPHGVKPGEGHLRWWMSGSQLRGLS